jgi:H+/Cl- antiporter ClcA
LLLLLISSPPTHQHRGQLIKSLSGSQGHSWVPVTWFCVVVFAGALCLVSAAAIIFVEPNAAGSGIPETSAFLNGTRELVPSVPSLL